MKFKLFGMPFTKQSARFCIMTSTSGKQYVHSYQKKEVREAEQNLKVQIINLLPPNFKIWEGPVRINKLTFTYPLLKSMSKKVIEAIRTGDLKLMKDTQPDLGDNLMKGLFDAIEGVLYINDRQIVEINSVSKKFGVTPGILLDIEETKKERWSCYVKKT